MSDNAPPVLTRGRHSSKTAETANRYNVARVTVPATGVLRFDVGGMRALTILSTTPAQKVEMKIGENGGWILIENFDRLKCSPVERLFFRSNDGLVNTVVFIYSNDPNFEYFAEWTSPGTRTPWGIF